MKKNLNFSIDIPLEEQYGENKGWENSVQRYELDSECQNKEYFEDMDFEDLLHVVRHTDNFIMERGVSEYMIHNHELAVEVFKEKCNNSD